MNTIWAELASRLQAPLWLNHPLARYTSWRVGGLGEAVLIPQSMEDLVTALSYCPMTIPITFLGLGSNVLISDQGLKGLVLITQASFLNQLRVIESHEASFVRIYVEAGVPCGQLARFTARQGLQGLEFLAGIPGTLGGALRMNAGCYGGETWNHLTQVETINRQGLRRWRNKEEFITGYRHVAGLIDEYFLAAYFDLSLGDKETSLNKIKKMLEQRNQSQPTNLPNCGSVFKNPPGEFAAALIERCGLKGYRMGQAEISEKHANFIVNKGQASSEDILNLIALVKEKVKEKFNIVLEQEVKVMK